MGKVYQSISAVDIIMDPSWCGRTFIEEVIPVTHVSGKNSRHAIMQDFQQNTDIECVPDVQKQKNCTLNEEQA